MTKNSITVILVGLCIGGIVGGLLGLAADKPLPATHTELIGQMQELDRRMEIDVTQADQLQVENEDIDNQIRRLRSGLSGEPAANEVYWQNLARFTAEAKTAGEILRSLDRWGRERFGTDWPEFKVPPTRAHEREGQN